MNLRNNIAVNRAALLTCEALGFLHNIGKLDKRFMAANDFDFQQVATPDVLPWETSRLTQLQTIATGKDQNKQKECAKNLALAQGKSEAEFEAAAKKTWGSGKNRYFGMAGDLGQKHFSSGCNLMKLLLFQGVGLKDEELKSFVGHFIDWRTGSQGTAIDALPVLGKEFPFGMLLNLFWDAFHWRTFGAENKREDNLTAWLGEEYEEFSRFVRIMAVCHEAISRGDKGEGNYGTDPTAENMYWTNVFGTEEKKFEKPDNLAAMLSRGKIPEIINLFQGAASDGKPPLNDVSLYSYCYNFGAFLKTALAKILIDGECPEPHDVRWRLLWFRHDGMEWFGQGGRLADAVARRRVWDEVLQKITDYLEVELPLARCLYRDTNGVFFLAPDVENLLDMEVPTSDVLQTTLREKIRAISAEASNGEIALRPKLSAAMKGYEVRISSFMSEIEPMTGEPGTIEKHWREKGRGIHAEVCTVCGLRPIAHKKEVAGKQRVCEVCHDRRGKRVAGWKRQNMAGTIWTSELADSQSGRCALVTGSLEVKGWLDGTLFQSLAGKCSDDEGTLAIEPSFTRVRDVWETTLRFWLEVDENLADPGQTEPVAPMSGRWQVRLYDPGKILKNNLAYEMETTVGRLQVCTINEPEPELKTLVVVDRRAPDEQVAFMKLLSGLEQVMRPVRLYLRGGYGGGDEELGSFALAGVPSRAEMPFVPYLNVLADPLNFMAVVPANRAMAVADWLFRRHQDTFNRVQDRLPLRLGLIYFPEQMPIFAVLDAGLKMISNPLPPVSVAIQEVIVADGRLVAQLANGTQFSYVEKIGDRPDEWYVRPKLPTEFQPLVSRIASGCQAMEYLPSALDVTWLAESSRRHLLHYDASGHRRDSDFGSMPQPPEACVRQEEIWKIIKTLSRSQLGQLETARDYADAQLAEAGKEAKIHFLCNSLVTSGSGWWKKLNEEKRQILRKGVESEELWSTLAHRLHLLKEKLVGETNHKEKENEL